MHVHVRAMHMHVCHSRMTLHLGQVTSNCGGTNCERHLLRAAGSSIHIQTRGLPWIYPVMTVDYFPFCSSCKSSQGANSNHGFQVTVFFLSRRRRMLSLPAKALAAMPIMLTIYNGWEKRTMRNQVFWDVTPCRLANIYWCFEWTQCFHIWRQAGSSSRSDITSQKT